MKIKAASGIMLTLLLIGMLILTFNIQPVKASGTIYIRADGSVEPSTANITSVDNVTYTFTGNINESIVVERNNIVIDGAGHMVRGTGSGTGIDLTARSNVTIKNTEIKSFDYGIWLYESSNNSVHGNNVTNNKDGIWLIDSSNNSVSGNNVANNGCGVGLQWSSNNSISGNNITENKDYFIKYGIYLESSLNNRIYGNFITNNGFGIYLATSTDNIIYHNNFINNTQQHACMWGYTNFWDDGYPSGGNYWSDYNGTDIYSGPYQNETGSDGIGDTPYVIGEDNTDRYPLMKPYGVQHDIGITNITTSKTIIGQGYSLHINIRIVNYGVNIENFNVTVYANTTIIATFANTTLTSKNSTTVTFNWNTTSVPYGNYTITAYAWPVPGETDTADNTYPDGWVVVTRIGDVNGDGSTNMLDIILCCINMGPVPPKPPECDINDDGTVDIIDIILCCINMG